MRLVKGISLEKHSKDATSFSNTVSTSRPPPLPPPTEPGGLNMAQQLPLSTPRVLRATASADVPSLSTSSTSSTTERPRVQTQGLWQCQ